MTDGATQTIDRPKGLGGRDVPARLTAVTIDPAADRCQPKLPPSPLHAAR